MRTVVTIVLISLGEIKVISRVYDMARKSINFNIHYRRWAGIDGPVSGANGSC